MPDHGHPQPPDDHPRCDCGGCREFAAITADPRREEPRYIREDQRRVDRQQQRRLEEEAAEQAAARLRAAG